MDIDFGAAYLAACEIYGWRPSFEGYLCYEFQVKHGYRSINGTWCKGGQHADNKDMQTVR